MSFQYFRYKKGEQVEYKNDINHIVYLLKGLIIINGKDVDDLKVNTNEFIILSHLLEFSITILADSEVVLQEVALPFYVCERSYDFYKPYLDEKINCTYRSLEIRQPLLACIHSVAYLAKDKVCCDHMIRAKMQEIFLLYKHYYTTEELIGLLFPFNKRMEFHYKVMAHYPKASTVKELASLCGYGLSNFKILFKKHFKDPPYLWMIKQKIRKLENDLLDSSIPIKAIVLDYGFSDQSHLNNYCKKYLGGTAIQVRKRVKLE